jgi:type IV secretion system protein VirB6
VALFLFDSTRGLFDGWLRATFAFALAPAAANVFGAAMLIMMAPFLDIIAENAALGAFDMGPIVTLGLIVIVFAIVMAMAFRAAATIAGGFATHRRARDLLVEKRNGAETPAPGAQVASGATRALQSEGEHVASIARRTEVLRVEDGRDAAFERLGQAYRRGPRNALKPAGGAA